MSLRTLLALALPWALTPIATAQNFTIDWYTIEGGSTGSAATFELRNVSGQPDATGTVSAGTYSLTGGFLVGSGAPACPADIDNDGNCANGASPDGGLDVSDLLTFLCAFEAGNLIADLDNDGVDPQLPDGGVDVGDLLFFLAHFEAGC